PAGRTRVGGIGPREPGRGRQDAEGPAADAGDPLESVPLGRRARVEPGDRRANRPPRGIDRDERRALARDADGVGLPGGLRERRTGRTGEPRPPGVGVLLGAPGRRVDVERVIGPRQAKELAVRGDERELRARRAEVDAEQRSAHAGRPETSVLPSASAATASAVATSVTSTLTNRPRSAPRIGATLDSPSATPIVVATPGRPRGSKAIVRSRSWSPTRRPWMSNGAIRTSPTAPAAASSAIARDPMVASLQVGPPMPRIAASRRPQSSVTLRTPGWVRSAARTAGASRSPGAW